MNLHILTISSRDEFLEQIYNSIPSNADIKWHICRGGDKFTDISHKLRADYRVKVYHIDCPDTDTAAKMQYLFNTIVETDNNSYFCILDDDTQFHPGMYKLFQHYKTLPGELMIIGKQRDKHGVVRLPATLPYECAIDSGNVLCHSSVLNGIKWATEHWSETMHVDFEFWNRCYQHFGLKRTDIIDRTISIYNKFSSKPDTLDYVR